MDCNGVYLEELSPGLATYFHTDNSLPIPLCVDAQNQQYFDHFSDFYCLPGLNQTQAEDKVSCSRTQHSASLSLKLASL